MSKVRILVFSDLNRLLSKIFGVVMLAVGVPALLGYLMFLPVTVMKNWLGSVFPCLIFLTM